jgi:hypothetical protein
MLSCVCVVRPASLCVPVPQPFGNILGLVPLAESVVKLNAVCMQCYKEAAYTKRLGEEQEVRGPWGPQGAGRGPHSQRGPQRVSPSLG